MRNLILLVLAACVVFVLCSCTITTNNKTNLQYNTSYPISVSDYSITINGSLVQLISMLQPLRNSEYLSEYEINVIKNRVKDIYENISEINPPESRSDHHYNLLQTLQNLYDTLNSDDNDATHISKLSILKILSDLECYFCVSMN